MSDYFAMSETELNALANAIKQKTGHTGQILGSQMASEIQSISSLSDILTGGSIYVDFDVPNYAFYNNKVITSVTFGPNCHSIGSYAFQNCSNLASVNMSNSSITTIGDSAFQTCLNLETVSFSSVLQTIGASAFAGTSSSAKSKLTGRLIFPDTLTSIGSSAFNCCNVTSVEFNGTGALTLYAACFGTNSNLTEVVIKNSSRIIGQSWTSQSLPFMGTPFATSGNTAHVYYPSNLDYPNANGWKATPYNTYLTPITSSATIGTDTYSYDYGKSFAQWVASAYNTDGFVVSGNNILNSAKTHYVAENGKAVTPTKQFIGTTYTLEAI